jgi:hypothetical protein
MHSLATVGAPALERAVTLSPSQASPLTPEEGDAMEIGGSGLPFEPTWDEEEEFERWAPKRVELYVYKDGTNSGLIEVWPSESPNKFHIYSRLTTDCLVTAWLKDVTSEEILAEYGLLDLSKLDTCWNC